jgi:hypothetical protein
MICPRADDVNFSQPFGSGLLRLSNYIGQTKPKQNNLSMGDLLSQLGEFASVVVVNLVPITGVFTP